MHKRQQKALACLLSCPTVTEAARAAGVSERTMYRYMDDAEFSGAYKDAVKRVTDEAAARLIRSMGPAIQTLEEVCQDGRASPHARVQASNSLLSHALRAIDRRTIEMSGPAPTFIYNPRERDDETIPPERYAEVERILFGYDENDEGRKEDGQEETQQG